LLPLHRYPRHGHSTYNACIYTCPPARRGGYDVLIRNLCPLLHFCCVFPSLDIRLDGTAVHTVSAGISPSVSSCLCLFSPFPLAFPSVQDDVSTLDTMLLSTTPTFTNVRLRAGRASPNRSLTEAGVVCPKFPHFTICLPGGSQILVP